MAVITIPFNYSEITHPQIVPICITDTDVNGNPVRAEWIEKGVVPVADRLVSIAGRVLSDKYRASEIAEYACIRSRALTEARLEIAPQSKF